MNEKSFDVSIPIAFVLVVVAAWQFYGLVSDGPNTRYSSSVELAVSPSPAPRTTDSPGN